MSFPNGKKGVTHPGNISLKFNLEY